MKMMKTTIQAEQEVPAVLLPTAKDKLYRRSNLVTDVEKEIKSS
jgi:hypothetical protein